MRCDVFEVTGASDSSFNGEYEVSPFHVAGALEDETVYEKINGDGKFIFKNVAGWALGSQAGAINYSGKVINKIKIGRSIIKGNYECGRKAAVNVH